jgi:hypothetical protein
VPAIHAAAMLHGEEVMRTPALQPITVAIAKGGVCCVCGARRSRSCCPCSSSAGLEYI